jgi:hypothetical protein
MEGKICVLSSIVVSGSTQLAFFSVCLSVNDVEDVCAPSPIIMSSTATTVFSFNALMILLIAVVLQQ